LKTSHFDKEKVDNSIKKLNDLKCSRGLIIAEQMKNYFELTRKKIDNNKQIVCSSDIIESCFGKYKEVVKLNKTIGVTDICLSISCLTNDGNIQQLKKSLESTKIEDIKKWSEDNIGESLFKKRTAFYKEYRVNKKIKKAA